MKTKAVQRRYRAPKRSACGLCKPQQRGRADKKNAADLRQAIRQEQEIQEWEKTPDHQRT
jgi:hypothetical protein